ncbi:MAG: DMT family transporter [Solirubrobacteraceae bacterium]
MDILLALAAAFCFALGTVLQQKAAVDSSEAEALRAGFLLRLARRPVWVAGLSVDALGFVFQAWALGVGRLVVVQPLLAATVVFALPLGARITDQHVTRRDVIGAVAVTAGIAAFLAIGDPSGGRDDAPLRAWLVAGAVIAAICSLLVLGAIRAARPRVKAALFGTATGILFALSAALTKATVDQLGDGIGHLVTDWHLYGLIAVGYVSMSLSQISLQTGALAPAIATQMALDPIAAVPLGILVFHETLNATPLAVAGCTAAGALIVAGLVALASSRPAADAVADGGTPALEGAPRL